VTDMFGIISFGLTMLTVELPGDRHRVAIRTIEKLLRADLFQTTTRHTTDDPGTSRLKKQTEPTAAASVKAIQTDDGHIAAS